jgi:hypothetical protein
MLRTDSFTWFGGVLKPSASVHRMDMDGAEMINQKAAWIQKIDISGVVCIGKRMRIRFLRSALIVKSRRTVSRTGVDREMEQTPTPLLFWISSILPTFVYQMALSLSVFRRFDSIAFTGSRGASESLFEARQKPHGPYFKWETVGPHGRPDRHSMSAKHIDSSLSAVLLNAEFVTSTSL